MVGTTYLYKFISTRLFFSLSLLHLLAESLSSMQPNCHAEERVALLQFKDSFMINKSASINPSINPYPKVSSWTLNDCCSWDGVECDEHTGHVIGLDLSRSCLYGSFDSNSSLFRLHQLQKLILAYNHFNYSQIPFRVGHFSRLAYLDLSHSVFSGRVPQSLANLSFLTDLRLDNCALYGEFPTTIFYLPNLQHLSIGDNQDITGHLPELYSSSSLEYLSLRQTSFFGELPASIGNFNSLSFLDLGNCNFSGSIPPSISNLTHLNFLDLPDNTFTGHIPSSLSNLTQLTYLGLSNNHLEGSIPSSFSELKNAEFLDFSENRLSGMVELDVFLKLKNLSVLMLSSNNLYVLTKTSSNDTLPQSHTLALGSCSLSKFPVFLKNQSNLIWLDLRGNNFQGLIPKWMYNVSVEALRALFLDGNFLTAFEQTPAVLPWRIVEYLTLGGNMLQGALPIPAPSTKRYGIEHNSLIGEISPLICNVSSLEELLLFDNNLSGTLPHCLGNFSSSLSVFDLSGNNFYGPIPKTWAKGSSLRMIDLSQNQLQGQLPKSLANCTMLEYLHVGTNQINDTFPFWLGTLPQLKLLVLRSNEFYGVIRNPETNHTFPMLRIIDISHNHFSGNLPSGYFQHWIAMKTVESTAQLTYMQASFSGEGWDSQFSYSVTITNRGKELNYYMIQDTLSAVDLSSNRFEGKIPEDIGNLKALHLLNLSNNALTGQIPPSLGSMTELESLDLSRNKLYGEIPPKLTELNFLAFVNVSHNSLVGPIPRGRQFDTFQNGSYEGNSGLCGNPLSNKCENVNSSPHPPSTFKENQGSNSAFEFDWKVVAMGYACGLVVGVFIGQIVGMHTRLFFF